MILQHLIDNVQRIAHAKFGQNPIEIDWEMAIIVKKVTFLEFSAIFLGQKWTEIPDFLTLCSYAETQSYFQISSCSEDS